MASFGLRHDVIVSRDNDHGDVGHFSPGAYGKGFVYRRIEEGDPAVLPTITS